MGTARYITHTRFARIFDMKRQLRFVVDYLIANRTVIASQTDLAEIFSTKAMLATPMTNIFNRLMTSGYMDEFATILKVTDNKAVPDILTMSSIVVDLKQSGVDEPLKPYPELYNKIIMNDTGLIRFTNTGWHVSAIQELHSMYVRAMLSRSYAVTKGLWMSPAHLQFIVRSYAMLIATTVARNTGLSYNELLIVGMIFALYMCQMLFNTPDRFEPVPQVFYHQNYLGQNSDLVQFTDTYSGLINEGLDLDKCCELVGLTGPARLKRYNTDLLYRQCSSLGSYIDTITTRMSLEYPPYWVWMVLQSVSGAKLGQFGKILQQHRLTDGAKKFADEITKSQILFESR